MAIDGAWLSSAGDADPIHVRVEHGGPWVWPRRSLLEGPAVEAVRGNIDRRAPPAGRGFHEKPLAESPWSAHESAWVDLA